MKTPLTITAKLWNYCQNATRCPYCVAGCSSDHWMYRGDGDFKNLPPHEILNVDRLIDWIKTHAPGCELHVSGGEPLLRPDVEDQIEKLVNNNIAVTITTNGMYISKRPRLLTMPLKWVVSHHECNDWNTWRYNADLIKNRPHIACRLLFGAASVRGGQQLAPLYQGLNFMWGQLHSTRITDWQPNPEDLDVVASDVIHLIEPDGVVYPCNNNSKRPIGNIYTGEYCKDTARAQNAQCRECVRGNLCGAYQTAVLVYRLRCPSHSV